MMSVTSYVGQGQPFTDGDITFKKQTKRHHRFLSLFYSIGMSWSVDKSYGPNTTNTFLSLSPAIHFYWYLALNQSTLRPLKNLKYI